MKHLTSSTSKHRMPPTTTAMIDQECQCDFSCHNCAESLVMQRYIYKDMHPVCVPCYEKMFTNGCDKCSKPIGINSKDLSYKHLHWHEYCFCCDVCHASLVDKPFGIKEHEIYCAACFDEKYAPRCDACNEPFKAGARKLEFGAKKWHDRCFRCAACDTQIGTSSFVPKNDVIYCAGCYEQKFSTKCAKCDETIAGEGVSFRGAPWHKTCFTCQNCRTSLAAQRFTVRDEQPYCAPCFAQLFAKKCFSCTLPITGAGGAKLIQFEGRYWHHECFACSKCRAVLSGKGFITDGTELLCADCAQAKLYTSGGEAGAAGKT